MTFVSIENKLRTRPISSYVPTALGRYATLCGLVGVDPNDTHAHAHGLPPIDSLDMWPMITGRNETSPRVEIPLRGGPAETVPGRRPDH